MPSARASHRSFLTRTSRLVVTFAVPLAILGGGLSCEGGESPPPLPAAGEPRCLAARTVGCVDQAIASLRLLTEPSPAVVTTTTVDGVFESKIDATGGGLPPSLSYVYVRFAEDGLEKVAIGDEGAFESMGWDLAFRRYLIRVNGGASGPSCVDAAVAGDAPLNSLQQVPTGLEYDTDLYFEEPSCAPSDNTDPMGGPLTAISGYFSYEACLAMTGENYVIRLASGRYVAMKVTTYYSKTAQDYCNLEGRLPGGPSGAGQMTIRWKFLAPPAG